MRALITGGARRVGRAITERLAEAGCSVVIQTGRSQSAAVALANSLPDATVVVADLSTPEGCRHVVDAVTATGGLDVLVNNAAAYDAVPFSEITPEAYAFMQALNTRAPFLLTQGLLPLLRQSSLEGGGSVVNLVDIGGERPAPGFAHYSVSKAGLHMLTRALAVELAPSVRVNGVSPGTVLPPPDLTPKQLGDIVATIPAGRVGTADDIARTVRFLALESPYVTGQIWSVDGGRSVAGALAVG
jgi:pteridine reductase